MDQVPLGVVSTASGEAANAALAPPSARAEVTRTLEAIGAALRAVEDPEYPGVSVSDMGMVGKVRLDGDRALIELIPTFSGCPALSLIVADIERAVGSLEGVAAVTVQRSNAAWTPARLNHRARSRLAEEFKVAVADASGRAVCPRCSADALDQQSLFGPARCRAVMRCSQCNEIVEMLRA